MESRLKKIIKKFSPNLMWEYQKWIDEGKPEKFTVYLLHDPSPGLKIKKIGSSKTVWRRVFGGLNYRYFYNFKLIDKKHFRTAKLMREYEKIILNFYKNEKKAKANVLTIAYNRRSDLKSIPAPAIIDERLANGGSENFKDHLLPQSFNEIEREIRKYPKYNNLLINFKIKEKK